MGDEFATPDRAMFIEVNRTRLRAWCWGDPAAPPVVLVHGAYDHGRTWDDFAPRLVELGFRVGAIDVRGHGDSGRLSSGMVWSACTLDLCELARVLAPTPGTPIGMIGHSMGGGQIVTAAATMPERFAWLVNLDGLGPPADGFGHDDIVDMATRSLDEIDKFAISPPRPWASRDQLAERRGAINIRLPRPFLEHWSNSEPARSRPPPDDGPRRSDEDQQHDRGNRSWHDRPGGTHLPSSLSATPGVGHVWDYITGQTRDVTVTRIAGRDRRRW